MTFTACSEKPFYVHCSYHFWQTEYYKLLFTTTAIPKRTPLVDVRPGPLAMSSGLGAIAATIQGEEHQPCVDWQKGCNEFLAPSLSDPLPLWPPPGDMWIVTGPFETPLPPDRFIELGFANKLENRGRASFFFSPLFLLSPPFFSPHSYIHQVPQQGKQPAPRFLYPSFLLLPLYLRYHK